MNMRSFFEAISVSCVVPAQSPADDERTVFENLSFAVERGEIVDLVGPSGSGKSSLLTACARLNPHAHGTFALDGVGSDEFSAQQWRRDVSYLPQKPILTGKDVAEVIRLPWTLAIRGKGGKADQLLPDERIRTTLDAMGCEDIDLERAPHDLSGGQTAWQYTEGVNDNVWVNVVFRGTPGSYVCMPDDDGAMDRAAWDGCRDEVLAILGTARIGRGIPTEEEAIELARAQYDGEYDMAYGWYDVKTGCWAVTFSKGAMGQTDDVRYVYGSGTVTDAAPCPEDADSPDSEK